MILFIVKLWLSTNAYILVTFVLRYFYCAINLAFICTLTSFDIIYFLYGEYYFLVVSVGHLQYTS